MANAADKGALVVLPLAFDSLPHPPASSLADGWTALMCASKNGFEKIARS